VLLKHWHFWCTFFILIIAIAEDLVSIWNAYENNFVMSLFWPQTDDNIEEMWTGLYYVS